MTRVPVLLVTGLACASVALSQVFPKRPLLIWNASPSAPIGLYALRGAGQLHRGELVAIEPPEPLAEFLARRRYLGTSVPLLKHVAAARGQRVCRVGRTILIDGEVAGIALGRDRRRRPLPVWRGCLTIPEREVFLMNPARDSLDSRYFGPLPTAGILGKAIPLWTRHCP